MKADFEPPKLSAWPFIVTDLVLVCTAGLIAWQSPSLQSAAVVWSITLLVFAGAVVLMIPLLVNHSRRSDVALAERQKEIAALAETTAASAEQLSVAVAGLNHVVDAATRAAKQADTLPQRLQERVNEFKEQLNEIAVNENEALSQELSALRASEVDRLHAHEDRIQKILAEMKQMEERWAADRAKAEKQTIDAYRTEVKADLEAFRSELASVQHVLARTEAGVRAAIADALAKLSRAAPAVRDEPPEQAPAPVPVEVTPAKEAPAEVPPPQPVSAEPEVPRSAAVEPALQPAEPTTQEKPAPVEEVAASAVVPPAAPRKPKRREDENQVGLDLGDIDQPAIDEPIRSLSADGATRLLVTAYIGIGNKLHVRGTGPGMAADKGSPLQFVSIGKWRWETEEATGPFTVQFYKNDQSPALNLGALTIEPGQQIEVKANF